MRRILAPDIVFSGLTPSGTWEASGADQVIDEVILGRWFSPDRRITDVTDVDATTVEGLEHVRYRLAVERPDGSFVVEQHAYYDTASGRISAMRVLCSGYRPVTATELALSGSRPSRDVRGAPLSGAPTSAR
jgi:hypothetical protein